MYTIKQVPSDRPGSRNMVRLGMRTGAGSYFHRYYGSQPLLPPHFLHAVEDWLNSITVSVNRACALFDAAVAAKVASISGSKLQALIDEDPNQLQFTW